MEREDLGSAFARKQSRHWSPVSQDQNLSSHRRLARHRCGALLHQVAGRPHRTPLLGRLLACQTAHARALETLAGAEKTLLMLLLPGQLDTRRILHACVSRRGARRRSRVTGASGTTADGWTDGAARLGSYHCQTGCWNSLCIDSSSIGCLLSAAINARGGGEGRSDAMPSATLLVCCLRCPHNGAEQRKGKKKPQNGENATSQDGHGPIQLPTCPIGCSFPKCRLPFKNEASNWSADLFESAVEYGTYVTWRDAERRQRGADEATLSSQSGLRVRDSRMFGNKGAAIHLRRIAHRLYEQRASDH
ncbi:hypothetical protein HDK64DRAFT_55884 [Phyllosticta capitalensis]